MNAYEYTVQGRYGTRWETVTTTATENEAVQMLDCYRVNERNTPFRITRVLAPDWGECDECETPHPLGGTEHCGECGNCHNCCTCVRVVRLIISGREALRGAGLLAVATFRAYATDTTGEVHTFQTRRPIRHTGWDTWHDTARAMITRAGLPIPEECPITADIAHVAPKHLHNGGHPVEPGTVPGLLLDPI